MTDSELIKQTAAGITQIYCASRGIEFEVPEDADLPIEETE